MQCVVFKGDVSPELFDARRPPPAGDEPRGRRHRQGAPASIKGEFEIAACKDVEVLGAARARVPDLAEGARHRLPDGPPPPLAALASASTRSCACATTIIKAVRDFFDEHGFTLVDAPIFTPNACEGTSHAVRDRLPRRARRTSRSRASSTCEAAAAAFGKVYCFGPTFRAEKSKTRRHLAEFWMVEPEVAFMDLEDDMDLAEDFLSYIVQRVLETRRARARDPRARHDAARARAEALPAHPLRRGDRDPAAERAPRGQGRRRLRRATTRPSISSKLRSPGDRHRYPMRAEGVLLQARSRATRASRSTWTCSRPRATARSSAAVSARTTSRTLEARDRRAQAAARSVRVVPRPAPLRHVPARRLRPRHRAHRGVDLRPPARARDHPVPAHAEPPRALSEAALTPSTCTRLPAASRRPRRPRAAWPERGARGPGSCRGARSWSCAAVSLRGRRDAR